MNVLIFVMTILMLLTLMTYARIESFRSSQITEILFTGYMEKKERDSFNQAADIEYTKIKVKSGKVQNVNQTAKGIPKISIGLLLDKNRAAKPVEWSQTQLLLKNLLESLYADQPFYQKISQERPQFIDELLSSLVQEIDALPKEKQLKNVKDLSNIELPDKQLEDVYYKMLKGAPYETIFDQPKDEKLDANVISESPSPEPEMEGDNESSEPTSDEPEYRSPSGYFSVLDFLSKSPYKPVRVYLAPKEVLKAIYPHDEIVNDIIKERKQLYREAQGADKERMEALTTSFESHFDGKRDPSIDKKSLDYTVNKTNPKNYD